VATTPPCRAAAFALHDHDLFALAAIAVPALLRYGVEDVAAPVGQGRWLAAHIPKVEVWESQTGGHLPEEPEAEITQTLAWLTGQAGA
jgi:pimeloyl-ACP methyl ester carboxylesterase